MIVASLAVFGLIVAIGMSLWRAHKTYDILNGVMIETAKTTSMVFIILIGAAMLTSAFRGFGGEVLVKEYLTGLPGRILDAIHCGDGGYFCSWVFSRFY